MEIRFSGSQWTDHNTFSSPEAALQYQESRPLIRPDFQRIRFRILSQSDFSGLTLSMRRDQKVDESRTFGVRPDQKSRFLVLTKRSVASELSVTGPTMPCHSTMARAVA